MAQTSTSSPRCDHRSELGLGCSRSAGHSGAHWLLAESSADAAFADLVRQGFFAVELSTADRRREELCAHAGAERCDAAGECVVA